VPGSDQLTFSPIISAGLSSPALSWYNRPGLRSIVTKTVFLSMVNLRASCSAAVIVSDQASPRGSMFFLRPLMTEKMMDIKIIEKITVRDTKMFILYISARIIFTPTKTSMAERP